MVRGTSLSFALPRPLKTASRIGETHHTSVSMALLCAVPIAEALSGMSISDLKSLMSLYISLLLSVSLFLVHILLNVLKQGWFEKLSSIGLKS